MNAKEYRIQRDAAMRKHWRAEGTLKDILNYIGITPIENESADCWMVRKMVQDYLNAANDRYAEPTNG